MHRTMLDNTSGLEEIRGMTNTGNSGNTYTCELCREEIVDVNQAEHMELTHQDTRTFSLADAMSDPTARCAVTILVGNLRKVESYPYDRTPHETVAEYLRNGCDLVSSTRDRVEMSGGSSVVILVHRIPTDTVSIEIAQDNSIYYALMREHAARLNGKG
jgi:hypothetical protein